MDADLQPRITAGEAAQRLLESEDYSTAIAETQAAIMREWAQTVPADKDERERLYYEMRAVQRVDHTLRLRAEDGSIAKKMLANIRKAVGSVLG